MNKTLGWLGGLLVLQLMLAMGLFLDDAEEAALGHESVPLLAFQPAEVNKLLVRDGNSEVTLTKSGDQWHLPGLKDLPADPAKLDDLLARLGALKTTWPVTTTKSSHARLEVAADKFARKISLYAGDKLLTELFLGTSPGFKQVYVRPAAGDNVYALDLSTYDFPVKDFDWLDKGLLDVQNVTRVEEKDVRLVKSDSQWSLDESGNVAPDNSPANSADIASNSAPGAPSDNASGTSPDNTTPAKPNADKVAAITETLGGVRVMGLAEKAPDFSSPDALSLKVSGDKDWVFQLVSADNKYYIKRNDIDAVFIIDAEQYHSLSTIGKKDLLAADTGSSTTPGEAPLQEPIAEEAGS